MGDEVKVKINAKIYPLEIIYSAAYVFLDRSYIIIDGDPNSEVIVTLKPKDKTKCDNLADEFNNELVNYAHFKSKSDQNSDIRNMILQRALLTNDPNAMQEDDFPEADWDDEGDVEDIAVPWEEKYGAKADTGENDKD